MAHFSVLSVHRQEEAHFKPRKYTDRDGNEKQTNDVDRFYDYDEKFFPVEDSANFGGIPVSAADIPF